MKLKRKILLFLIISIIVTMVPFLSVSATNIGAVTQEVPTMILLGSPNSAVEYTRKVPEVAILNMHNGNSAEFYSTLMDASSSYNGIRLFGKTVDSQLYADDVFSSDEYIKHGMDDELIYEGFKDENTILYKLNTVVDQFNRPIHNLEVGVSGTFHNNWHMHATKFHMDFEESVNVQLPEEVHIMSYSGLILEMDNKTIIQQYGSKKDYVTNPRIGDLEFASLKQFSQKKEKLSLWITRSGQYFDSYKQYCTCGGHYVDKTVVAFRDQSAPQISEVWLNNQNIYGVKNKVYKSGDEIEITIKYNEPIRFADDSAEGKEDLYVKLVVDGVLEGQGGDIHPKAYLTKLDNNKLYFSYTVPEGLNSSYKISQIDLSPLMGTEIELKHVGPVAQYKSFTDPIFNNTYQVIDSWSDGTFEVKVPSDVGGKALGFTETTSYITDLAGNPINNEIIKSDFSIDTQKIEIIEISPSFFISQPNIKEMLGKTDPADPGYADNSDTYMGGMAMFKINATFNKLLAINNDNGIPVNEPYNGLVATTNMRDEKGGQITLTSDMAFSIPSKNTEMSSGYVTKVSFRSSNFVNAYEHRATCDDEDGILRITSITYATGADQLEDIVGNKFEEVTFENQNLLNKTLFLDADKAIATTSLSKNEDDPYSPEPVTVGVGEETRAFRFPFTVEDSGGNVKSGVSGLTGTFAWAKIGASSSQNWPYQYLITTKPQLDGTEVWLEGFTGNHFYDFVQIEEITQYIYIRPVVDHDYSLFDTELRFKPLDYAGNEYRWNEFVAFPLDITWEDEAPTAAASDVRRSLGQDNTGTIEVDVLVQDQSALDKAYYLWSDEIPTPRISEDSNWIQTNIVFDSTDQRKTGKITATATVPANSEFSQYLWVRVLDKSGNELITNLGLYEYNLKEVAYELKYSTGITSAASLQLEKMEADGMLVFMVPVPGTPNEYFVRVFGANVGDRETSLDRDAFRHYALSRISGSTQVLDTFWQRMTVTESSGKYTFVYRESADESYINSITRGTTNESQPYFSGNLQVIVLSGIREAFNLQTLDSEKYAYPLEAGTETHPVAKETVSLRVSHNKESVDTDTFQNITFSPQQTINVEPGPKSNEHHWNSGDPLMLSTAEGVKFSVDLGEDTYGWNYEDVDFANSYIELQLINKTTTHLAYLKTGKTQTVVFPNADYEQGAYKVTLYVNCFAGKGYKIDLKDFKGQDIVMYIDTSPAAKSFGISALKYTPDETQYKDKYYSHGLDTQSYFNWETDSYSSGQVIYLPAHLPGEAHELTVEVKGYEDISEFAISVWNVTANGQKAGTYYYDFYEISQHRSLDFEVFETIEKAHSHNGLGLVKNQENIIAVQIQNRNGINSQIKYYNIYPVDEEVKGTTSVTRGADSGHVVASGNIIFTPDEGQLMDGVRVFATAIPIPLDKATWTGIPKEMLPQYDGTYIAPLVEGINQYFVYSIDKYGNLNLYDYDIEGNAFYNPLALVEEAAPAVTVLSSSVVEGNYTAVFKIEDATLNARAYERGYNSLAYMPLTINLSFDENYTEKLGITSDNNLEFTLNENEDEFIWKASGRSLTGIYEVRAERKRVSELDPYYLEVTVLGAVHYQENDSGQTFTLYLDATDASGNSTFDEINKTGAEFVNVISAKPRAYTSKDGSDKKPVYDYVGEMPYNASHMALILKFNMPVLPESSWINPEPQYGTVQVRAFPITINGTHEIKFYDVFGNSFVQELTIDNVIDPGLTVEITPSDLTAGDVVVRIIDDEDTSSSGGFILFKKDGESLIPVSDDESIITEITSEKQITLAENTALVAYRYVSYVPYEDMVENNTVTVGYKTEITINNIVKSAPTAKAYLYFTETGKEYAEDEELPKETSGKIIVHYKATSKVVPTNSTGTEHTFKYGESDTYTFTFEDGLGQTGSLTVDLNALGVTMLEPTLTSPVVKDTLAPRLTLNMYAKRSNSYTQTDSFAGTATSETIKGVFDGAGYVQGYLFEVSVLEQSSYKIILMNTEPQGEISYDTAVNDSILGATLVGRMITLTPDLNQNLYIVVVDNAKAETGAENDNYAYVLINAGDLMPWFDTTAPTMITETVTNSLYEKTVYIKLTDTANDGHEIDYVNLSSPKLQKESGTTPETATYKGWYKLIFNDNSEQELVFSDLVGNRTTQKIKMSGIDDTKPEVKVVWSPPHVVETGDGGTIFETSPTLGPVNTDIKAIITADKPMTRVITKAVTYDGISWEEWPMFFMVPKGISFTPNLLASEYPVTELVTIVFSGVSGGVLGVRMEITAPNGQTSEVELQISEGAIDKTPPEITSVINYQYRQGFDGKTPYVAEIVLTPNEPAYCLNAGKAGVLYGEDNPLIITTILNETAVYRFADKAGNIGSVAVSTEDIDRTPPKITTDPANTKNLESSTSVPVKIKVDEACTITVDTTAPPTTFSLSADTEHTITFTENGVYQIKATDNAGNTSIATVVIGNIDKTAPMISFDNLTIMVRQESELSELEALLVQGVNVWDNLDASDKLTVTYQLKDGSKDRVDLSQPGLYAVPYTVKDTAGNEGYATRYVRVFDKNLPAIIICEQITEPEGTIVLTKGQHQLTVEGLKEISIGEMEPYTIKITQGIRSEGQMKYYNSTVPIDAQGKITLDKTGFYTLYITTQSRQSYRTLLYVEK